MARERDFRQRVVSTANLLLEAASMLEESREEGAPGNHVSSSRQIVQANRTPSTSRRPAAAQMSQPSLSSLPTAPGLGERRFAIDANATARNSPSSLSSSFSSSKTVGALS